MEIELNFQLDGNGRTSITNSANPSDSETKKENGVAELNYDFQTLMTNLAPPSQDNHSNGILLEGYEKWMDDLLFDCEISDCGLMPRTFWMPAQGMKPRCHLEQLALDIFHKHVPQNLKYDPSTSGAEWWTQIRPSPEGTGRYSMHDDQPDKLSKMGISFHWDKDEDLRILTGGTTYIHAHLSTVTYLTGLGAPTLALNYRVHNLTGEWIEPQGPVEGFLSWPKVGKHMKFDGRYLHAAPPDLMEPGYFDEQTKLPPHDEKDTKELRRLKRRHRRVTFLVNIWLNYHPYDVKPFPDSMIDKMSGTEDESRRSLAFQAQSNSPNGDTEDVVLPVGAGSQEKEETSNYQSFEWPMGDYNSKEFLEAIIPLESARKKASSGGNLSLKWEKAPDGNDQASVRLFTKTYTSKSSNKEDATTQETVIESGEKHSEEQATKRQKIDS